jgi:hypothetical protein
MPQKKGSPYGRKCLVSYVETDETKFEFGRWLAAQLETLANRDPDFIGKNNKIVYRECNVRGEPDKPVCHWVRHKDALLLLKKCTDLPMSPNNKS